MDSDLPKPGTNPDGIALLRELGLNPGSTGSVQDELHRVLFDAIGKLDLGRVKRIVEHGADVNARYCTHGIWCSGHAFVTPLMEAAGTRGALAIVRYLVEKGADPTIAREIREDIGYSDFKWEGTGKYETALDLTHDPEIREFLAGVAHAGG